MKFKNNKSRLRFFQIHPQLQLIACDMALYCHNNFQPFVITETRTTIEEDENINRSSSTHNTGRAIDIRTSHWGKEFREKFIFHFINIYWELGAVSSKDSQRNFMVHHNHHGWHIHVQLDRRFSC